MLSGLFTSSVGSDDPAEVLAYRRQRMISESPAGIVMIALTIATLTLINLAIGLVEFKTAAVHLLLAATLYAAARYINSGHCRPEYVAAIIAVCAMLCIANYQLDAYEAPGSLRFAYALLCMLGAGAFILSIPAFLATAIVSLVGFAIVVYAGAEALLPAEPSQWLVAGFTANLVAGIIILLRRKAVDQLGAASRRAQALAQQDQLTGLLNRHGMQERLQHLLNRARREDQTIYTCFVDIDALKAANDAHGHDFGDEVIEAVAQALSACAPARAEVARWGGDEFLVVGIGSVPDVHELLEQLKAVIAVGAIDLTKWSGGVSVGVASEMATQADIDALVAEADLQMYARRRMNRGGA